MHLDAYLLLGLLGNDYISTRDELGMLRNRKCGTRLCAAALVQPRLH